MIATIASRILGPESKLALSRGWENTADPTTLLPQVERLQGAFNLKSVILVGDRGMISQKQVKALKGHSGVEWITALKTGPYASFSPLSLSVCARGEGGLPQASSPGTIGCVSATSISSKPLRASSIVTVVRIARAPNQY